MKYVLIPALLALGFLNATASPPGSIRGDGSLFLPASYVKSFFSTTAPDSARIVFTRQLPSKINIKDTTSQLYRFVSAKDLLKPQSPFQDYKKVLEMAMELGYDYTFLLFYKTGHPGKYYKVRIHNAQGKLKKEMIFTDPVLKLVQETVFFDNGNVKGETQYRLRDTSLGALWFRTSYLRDGRKAGYQPSGLPRYIQYYSDNKRTDTSFFFDRNGELATKEIWHNDSLVKSIEIRKISKTTALHRKALLVGIDKYSYPERQSTPIVDSTIFLMRDLGSCMNDVDLLLNSLVTKQGFAPANITVVSNETGTRSGLLEAVKKFLDNVQAGDQVFLHFSGHSISTRAENGELEFAFACRDYSLARYIRGHDGLVRRSELEVLFNVIRKKVGRNGQLIISMDACESGAINEGKAKTKEAGGQADLRGESSDILFNSVSRDGAAMALFTATSGSQTSKEMRVPSGNSYGVYSYWLAKAFEDPTIHSTQELFEEVSSSVEEHFNGAPQQTPGYYSNGDFPLFEKEESGNLAFLPEVKKTGNAFVLSIGISQYNVAPANSKLKFNNCVADARKYDEFFKSQFTGLEGNKTFNSYLLTDTAATYGNIMKAINNIIFNSKPEDYFVLNFSGYCRQLTDSTGKRVTYFVPYGLRNIADTNEIKTKGVGIPLSQLKDLLQLIPANNQLFITEAGSTSDFQKEFIQALIESSPSIAALSNKNRIFMVPRSSGIDRFNCNQAIIDHGPLNYYITSLSGDLNVYGIFQDDLNASAVKYSLNKAEVECDFSRTGYFDIFFEREYISDLQHFLPEEISQSRGLGVNRETRAALAAGNSRKFALVVGTDKYLGKPDWTDLRNPVLDAKDIATELQNGFGYDVKLLLDAPMDSIYTHISWLSRNLRQNDQLIIYIAGHGDFDSALMDDGFIVCRDSKPIAQDPYRNSYIQYSKFSRMINRLPANQVLMALDVCFGGTFDERVARNQGRERTTDYDNLTNNRFFAEKLKKRTRLYLTSGGKDVVPDGLDKKHSPFALRLLQALQGRGGASKMLTAKNLHQFVEKLPSGPLLGSFGDDEVGSEFILISKE